MILILGSGYIGQAFARELKSRKLDHAVLSRGEFDCTHFGTLSARLTLKCPELLINAAGFCGQPNVDEVETRQADAILSNVVLPRVVADACALMQIPWIHTSSGCVYDSAHCHQPPEGFSENDTPNFSFRNPPCSFYSGTKSLAEEAIAGSSNCWICRLRLPFNEVPGPKNLLTKLQEYVQIYDSPPNSLSHLGDAVRACVDLWEKKASPGIYNVTNPGAVTNREIAGLIKRILNPMRDFQWWQDEATFYRFGAKAPRSNCILSTAKLEAAGIKLRPVMEALTWSLEHWQNRSSVGS